MEGDGEGTRSEPTLSLVGESRAKTKTKVGGGRGGCGGTWRSVVSVGLRRRGVWGGDLGSSASSGGESQISVLALVPLWLQTVFLLPFYFLLCLTVFKLLSLCSVDFNSISSTRKNLLACRAEGGKSGRVDLRRPQRSDLFLD